MKTRFVKKILVVSLAAVMALGCSLTALAASNSNKGSSSSNTAASSSAVAATEESAPEVVVSYNNAAGKSTVAGAYLANNIKGAAVSTSVADIKAGYGLTGSEYPYIMTFNVDAKKSPLVMSVFDAVAASQNAVVGPCVNVNFGKISGGKFALLPADGSAITMKFALKADFFTPGMNYAVICVRPGGAFSIIPAMVDANGVVYFEMTGGQASYAVIKF